MRKASVRRRELLNGTAHQVISAACPFEIFDASNFNEYSIYLNIINVINAILFTTFMKLNEAQRALQCSLKSMKAHQKSKCSQINYGSQLS